MEASEQTRDVSSQETIPFEAWPVHKIDGGRLEKKVVATIAGIQSISPDGSAQDAPARLTFVSGPTRDDRGKVTLKSTSNRGIGTLDLTFTVRPSVVLELEIDSKIKPTVLNMFTVKRGTATATGRIRLAEAEPDHWRGDGALASRTRSAAGGCRTLRVTGTGSYDWQVRDVVAGPDIAEADIVVDIDSGRQSEQPDTFEANSCPVVLTGEMNTWENLFFVIYHGKKNVNGLRVTGWTLDATADTWVDGGLVATAKWSGSCPTMQDDRPGSGDPRPERVHRQDDLQDLGRAGPVRASSPLDECPGDGRMR